MIGLAADHAGFEKKEFVKTVLDNMGIPWKDFGAFNTESCDYPDFGHSLGFAVEAGEVHSGIAVCSTGNGISITLNKHRGIRAALCWEEEIARLASAHNNANVLVLPGQFISDEKAEQCIQTFLSTQFEGGRHQRRINKIEINE